MNEVKSELFDGKCLIPTKLSKDWQEILAASAVFHDMMRGEISLICPVPNNKGTLIVQDHKPYLANEKTLAVIEKFFAAHRLMDYQLMKRVCLSLQSLPSKKVPMVNAHFALFPLTKPENSIWLNPLAIDQVIEKDRVCMARLNNGLSIEVPLLKKSFIATASKAVYSLATYRRDYSAILLSNGQPLDYVNLPTTPFGFQLSKHKILQEWLLTPGEFMNRYKLEEHLHWYRNYTGDFPEIDD